MLALAAALPPARAEFTAEAARANVAPFYAALNAAHALRSADLIREATSPDWVSCRSNDVCSSRDEVIAGVAARLKSVPELTWQIKDVMVAGNQVTVRGEATGTPAGAFMGTAHSGKSFKLCQSTFIRSKVAGSSAPTTSRTGWVRSGSLTRIDRAGSQRDLLGWLRGRSSTHDVCDANATWVLDASPSRA
ncbi:MAG TPA: ester cyclase [Bradyrhizobium sp.]|jgi:hypothetical protein|nr:ester cyclase [Bradyrhizobium sp.]